MIRLALATQWKGLRFAVADAQVSAAFHPVIFLAVARSIASCTFNKGTPPALREDQPGMTSRLHAGSSVAFALSEQVARRNTAEGRRRQYLQRSLSSISPNCRLPYQRISPLTEILIE